MLHYLRTLLCVLLCTFLLAGCGKKETPKKETPPRPVDAATAVAKNVPLFYDTLGKTTAFESVTIVSQVNGQIVESPFTQGSMVQKGDLLFKIYQPPYIAAVKQAEGALTQAKAELEINQLNVDRNRSLVPQKLISEQEFQTLQATVKENLGQIESAEGELLAAEVDLGYTEIRSPIDGMVGLYNVNIGNVVSALGEDELTTVQRFDPIYIDFIVAVPDFSELRKYFKEGGEELTVKASFLNDPSLSREGPMAILGNLVNTTTGTINLRATLENADAFFWPAQPVAVRVYLTELKGAIVVPNAAVSTGSNGQFVFVIGDGNTVKQTPVTIGQLQDDGTIVIEKGVSAGQKVVTSGQLMLRDGTQVSIKKLDGKSVAQPAAAPAKADEKGQ